MKNYKTLTSALLLFLFFSVTIFAQRKEMTQEEWQNEINRLTAKKVELNQELKTLQTEVADLKATDAGLQPYADCLDELYAIVGATKADVDNFRTQLNALTQKIDNKIPPKADRQEELDA